LHQLLCNISTAYGGVVINCLILDFCEWPIAMGLLCVYGLLSDYRPRHRAKEPA